MIRYLLFFLIFTCYNAYGNFYLVKINISSQEEFNKFVNSNIEFQKIDKSSIIAILNNSEYDNYIKNQFNCEILIDDLEKYNENLLLKNSNFIPKLQNSNYFQLGSMSGYFKLDEIYSEFDRMIENYPNYIRKSIISYSYENRPIYAYEVGSNDITQNSEIFFTGLIHSREPGTVFSLIYYFWDLFYRFDKDDLLANYILNNKKISFIPVVNPDGVVFNEINYPNGGGLWRKNRRKTSDSTFGTDLNRNFGPYYSWNFDNNGSLDNPIYDTYRGSSPFSEPETEAIKNFVESNQFKIAINFHTFGNSVFFPFSYLNTECSDSNWFRAFLTDNYNNTRYIYGVDYEIVNYSTRGSADDFLYLGNDKFSKIYSMTCEIGSNQFGFWPPVDSIINYAKNLTSFIDNVILSSDKNITLAYKDLIKIEDKFYIKFELQNIGLNVIENTEFLIKTNNENVILQNPHFIINKLEKAEQFEYLLEFSTVNFKNGEPVEFEISANLDYSKNIKFNLILFEYDEIDLFDKKFIQNWVLDSNWTFHNIDNELVLISNKDEFYKPDLNSFAKIKFENFDKKINQFALNFEHKYEIEANFDFATIFYGNEQYEFINDFYDSYLIKGIKKGKQSDSLYGFHGNIKKWKKENLYFKQNNDINQVAFNLRTDNIINKNGWKIKNLKLRAYPDYISSIDNFEKTNQQLKIEYFKDNFLKINSKNDLFKANIIIYNLNCEKLFTANYDIFNQDNFIKIPVLNTGIYFININNNNINFYDYFIKIE